MIGWSYKENKKFFHLTCFYLNQPKNKTCRVYHLSNITGIETLRWPYLRYQQTQDMRRQRSLSRPRTGMKDTPWLYSTWFYFASTQSNLGLRFIRVCQSTDLRFSKWRIRSDVTSSKGLRGSSILKRRRLCISIQRAKETRDQPKSGHDRFKQRSREKRFHLKEGGGAAHTKEEHQHASKKEGTAASRKTKVWKQHHPKKDERRGEDASSNRKRRQNIPKEQVKATFPRTRESSTVRNLSCHHPLRIVFMITFSSSFISVNASGYGRQHFAHCPYMFFICQVLTQISSLSSLCTDVRRSISWWMS